MTIERFIEIRETLKFKMDECKRGKANRMNVFITHRIRTLSELDKLAIYIGISTEELNIYALLKDTNGRILSRLANVKAQGYPIGISSQADIEWLLSFIPGELMRMHNFNQRLKNILAFGIFARVIGFPPEELIFFRATLSEQDDKELFAEKHWPFEKWPV